MDKSKFWVWIGLTVALAAAVGALFWHQQGDEAEVEAVPPRMILPGHPLYVGWLAFFPDGKTLLSAGYDNAIRFWDVDTGKLLNTAIIPNFMEAVLSPNGQLIAVGNTLKEAFLWNVSTGESTILAGSRSSDNIVRFSPNSRTIAMAVSNPDPSISIWDVETGARIQTVEGTWPIAYSPDSKRLVTTGNAARVWDIETGALVHTLGGRSGARIYTAYSPDSKRILTGSSESGIHIWDANTGSLIQTLQAPYSGLTIMTPAYHPDGKTISNLSETHITIWDADTGSLIQTQKKTDNDSHYLLPDGKNLVQSGPNTLTIWDTATGRRLHTLIPSSDRIRPIYPMALSTDGKIIAGADENGEIYIWDIE